MAENSDSERKRGAGRPFEKGTSPNPGGRPKLIREFQELLAKECYPLANQALIKALSSENEKVQMLAVRETYDRLFGKPVQAITGEDGAPLVPTGDLLDALRKLAGGK